MKLFIRHSYKQYKNSYKGEYRLDAPLTEEGIRLAEDTFTLLIEKYGAPPMIFSSPYLRTRQTAEIGQKIIENCAGIFVEIRINPQLSECLCNQTDKDLTNGWRSETLSYSPIKAEKWREYKQRMKKAYEENVEAGWYITHGLNVESIGRHYKLKHYPNEMGGIVVNEDKIAEIIF